MGPPIAVDTGVAFTVVREPSFEFTANAVIPAASPTNTNFPLGSAAMENEDSVACNPFTG